MRFQYYLHVAVAALTIFSFSPAAHSARNGWSFSAGVFQHNMFDLTRDKTGKTDTYGDTYLPLGLHYSTEVMSGWHFQPALHLTHITSAVLPKETPEKGAEKNLLFLQLPLVTSLGASADLRAGIGYFEYQIKGKGGTVTLNNGTGTSTFYKPSEKRTSKAFYLLLGAAFPFQTWRLDFDLMIQGPGTEEKRHYNMLFSAVFPLGSGY